MTKLYLSIVLLGFASPVVAQTTVPTALADTTRPTFANDSGMIRIGRVATALPAFTTIQPALSRIAGVQYTPFSGAPGAWAVVRIRGAASVTGSSQPLYVVDGIPVHNTEITPTEWTGAADFFTRV